MNQVISVLLLTVISVLMCVTVYMWVMNLAASYMAAVPELGCVGFRIQAVRVVRSGGGWQLTAYVQNTCEKPIRVVHIFIMQDDNVVAESTTTATVNAGEVGEVTIHADTLEEGHSYVLKVVTDDGLAAHYQFRV